MVLNHYLLTKNILTRTYRHQKLIGMINDDEHFLTITKSNEKRIGEGH